jgi:hypothetical protein
MASMIPLIVSPTEEVNDFHPNKSRLDTANNDDRKLEGDL